MLDIGLLHHLEELARVGGEALDVAPLALGIDGVERQARLAAAAEPGDHDQRIAREIDIEPLEVMLARAADRDMRETHRKWMFRKCSLGSRGAQGDSTGMARMSAYFTECRPDLVAATGHGGAFAWGEDAS